MKEKIGLISHIIGFVLFIFLAYKMNAARWAVTKELDSFNETFHPSTVKDTFVTTFQEPYLYGVVVGIFICLFLSFKLYK